MRATQAYRFALDPTPAQERKLASHAGAARFAYNWGLALVKDRLDRRGAGEDVAVAWRMPALRREWNAVKHEVAPWWAQNSKEAASSGLQSLSDGLRAFWESKHGKRKGPRVGFPRFKRRGRCGESFRYTTGSFGVSGRTWVALPRIGNVRTHEPTTTLQRKIDTGQARVLSATIKRERGRWYCSFCCEVERRDAPPARPDTTVGVDVGIKRLAVLSTGERIDNPRALERSLRRLRRYQRRVDRQRRASNPGCYDDRGRAIRGKRALSRSRRMRTTERTVARLHARAANVRADAMSKLTSRLAADCGTIVVERLNVAGMVRNRSLARALHDAALAELRRQLAYKTVWRGGTLIEAPTFFPSSKTCSACRTAKAKLSLSERVFRCAKCGLVLDRDENAARNLAALAERVAGSGSETENARSRPPTGGRTENPCKTRPRRAVGRPRSPQRQPAHQTGIVSEQPETA